MIRTQVQFTERQMQALKSLASTQKVSVAELVRRAVDAMCRAERTPTPEETRRRAIAVAGRFASGHSDVSRNHDQYLANAYTK